MKLSFHGEKAQLHRGLNFKRYARSFVFENYEGAVHGSSAFKNVGENDSPHSLVLLRLPACSDVARGHLFGRRAEELCPGVFPAGQMRLLPPNIRMGLGFPGQQS